MTTAKAGAFGVEAPEGATGGAAGGAAEGAGEGEGEGEGGTAGTELTGTCLREGEV